MALCGATALLSVVGAYRLLRQDPLPAPYELKVTRVTVPNIERGERVLLDVDRTVERRFSAQWTVEVQQLAGGDFVGMPDCTGSGVGVYDPTESLPEDVDLDWWIGHDSCELDVGEYRIITTWSADVERGPVVISDVSNTFAVR